MKRPETELTITEGIRGYEFAIMEGNIALADIPDVEIVLPEDKGKNQRTANLFRSAPELLFELASTNNTLQRLADSIGKAHPLWGMVNGVIHTNNQLIEKAQ